MLSVLGLAVAIWFGGRYIRAPVRDRLWAIGALWLAAIAVNLVLRDGHPLRVATGGSAEVWLGLGVLGALALSYARVVRRLRRSHVAGETAVALPAYRPAELDRYARHIMLREIGGPGQQRLKRARVLVIGAGGLGSPVLMYLAASGVGVIGVVDNDVVENSNLQRQVIHTDARIGMAKVQSAAAAMSALNPFIEVRPYRRRMDASLAPLISEYDLVLDGTDNFDTRDLVNRACVAARVPLISGAITQWEGQISLYDPARGGPCFACVFPAKPAPGTVPTCAEAGVAAPLPGVVGSLMAVEAVKAITGAGQGLRGRLMIYDALFAQVRVIGVDRRADCPVCGARAVDEVSGTV